MVEFPRPSHFREGHVFDTLNMRRQLWLLLTVFLADRAYAEITEDEWFADGYRQHLLGLNSDFADQAITECLLGVATSLRVIDDRDGDVLTRLPPCGVLWNDLPTDENIPLTLREACNKIIHARRLNFDIERLDGHALGAHPIDSPTYMRPFIHLYGTHRTRDWKAMLDIVAFARASAQIL